MTSRAEASAGFTLIELLVALVIVGLLMVVLPRTVGRSAAARFDAAVEQVAADLRRARSRAVMTALPQRFVVDVNTRRFGVEGLDPKRLPEGVAIGFVGAREERLGDRVGAIRFFPDGSSTGGAVRLEGQDRTREVRVRWLTGRVEVVDG
jgi:general secretion pathway protein H